MGEPMRYIGALLSLISLFGTAGFGRQAYGNVGVIVAVLLWAAAWKGGMLLADREERK